MILDSIERLADYRTFLPGIDKVVAYLKSIDLSHLPEKKVEIDGENLFVIPSVCNGKNIEDALLEAHNKYADIQLCLSAEETFGWRDRSSCLQPQSGFDESRDIIFFDDKPSAYVTTKAREFVLFMPNDAHAPLIYDGEVVKLIFKVKVG